jgi:hypothetical protein
MWRHKAHQNPTPQGVDEVVDVPVALDRRVIAILAESDVSEGPRRANRELNAIAVMLAGGGISTVGEFDRSLDRLEARSLIWTDREGSIGLTEQGRTWLKRTGDLVHAA